MNRISPVRFITISFAVLGLLLIAGINQPVRANETVKWKIQTHLPISSSSYAGSVERLVKSLKEKSNGRIELEIFPANAIVPSKEIFNAVKNGMLPMGTTSASYIRAQIPTIGVASGLPYSFKNVAQASYFIKELGYEQRLNDYSIKKHGVMLMIDRAYPTELVLKKPINSFEELKGFKLRSSGVMQKFLTSCGAAASYITGGEVYSSLSTGVVDGAHWGAAQGAYSMNFYDICKYHLKPALTVAGTDLWIINKKAFDKLPVDLQGTLLQTLRMHYWERSNQYEIKEAMALQKAQVEKGAKIITLSNEDQKKMTQAAITLWDEEAKFDPDYAKEIQNMKDFLKEVGVL